MSIIGTRTYQLAAAVAGVLALTASFTHVWWLVAASALVAVTAALWPTVTSMDDGPESRRPEKYEPRIVMPPTAEPDDVVSGLFRASTHRINAVAAHLWLQDPATATFRLVSAMGDRVPSSTPLPLDDPSIAGVAARGESTLEPVLALTEGAATTTLWRFAFPVIGSTAGGLGCVDIETAVRPDERRLEAIALAYQPALTTALALHVARAETSAAVNLLEAAQELSRRLSVEDVVRLALDRAVAISSAASGSVMLEDEETGTLRIALSHGLPEQVVAETVVSPGEGIAGWVFASGKPLLVEDLPHRSSSRRRGVRSAVSVPIADEDGALGVLNVGSQDFPARFTDEHLHSLESLGRQVAIALRNARAMESATDLYFATLTALTVALETKDPYARGTTGRVVEIVRALGSGMALGPVESRALNVAALLHDIGMGLAGGQIGTTARPLSTVERGMLKAHPVLAAEILADVPALREVVPIVYHHHEWYDGHGYVGGLAGEAIPLGSRILAVADAFVAMTSDRPYRRALSVVAALAELRAKAGTQFDPAVVEVLDLELARDPDLALTTRVD
jgi:HD-GYP domain-containing protein (c-di-GMP phosphodiesterase class II)